MPYELLGTQQEKCKKKHNYLTPTHNDITFYTWLLSIEQLM